jgi:hypothetical protein
MTDIITLKESIRKAIDRNVALDEENKKLKKEIEEIKRNTSKKIKSVEEKEKSAELDKNKIAHERSAILKKDNELTHHLERYKTLNSELQKNLIQNKKDYEEKEIQLKLDFCKREEEVKANLRVEIESLKNETEKYSEANKTLKKKIWLLEQKEKEFLKLNSEIDAKNKLVADEKENCKKLTIEIKNLQKKIDNDKKELIALDATLVKKEETLQEMNRAIHAERVLLEARIREHKDNEKKLKLREYNLLQKEIKNSEFHKELKILIETIDSEKKRIVDKEKYLDKKTLEINNKEKETSEKIKYLLNEKEIFDENVKYFEEHKKNSLKESEKKNNEQLHREAAQSIKHILSNEESKIIKKIKNPILKDYVEMCVEKGASLDNIRNALLKKGWTQEQLGF